MMLAKCSILLVLFVILSIVSAKKSQCYEKSNDDLSALFGFIAFASVASTIVFTSAVILLFLDLK
jgi:hypothetical protein